MIDWPKVVRDLERENAELKKRLEQREWVGLTDREIIDILWSAPMNQPLYAREIEAKLKEKNNADRVE